MKRKCGRDQLKTAGAGTVVWIPRSITSCSDLATILIPPRTRTLAKKATSSVVDGLPRTLDLDRNQKPTGGETSDDVVGATSAANSIKTSGAPLPVSKRRADECQNVSKLKVLENLSLYLFLLGLRHVAVLFSY